MLRGNRKGVPVIFYFTTFAILIIDQLIKFYVIKYLPFNQSLPILKNFLYVTYINNPGAAFGILPNQRVFLAFISILLVFFATYYFTKVARKEKMIQLSLSLILGGSLGNLIDRLFRGHVIDYIDIRSFSVFNLADIMINVGVLLLLIRLFALNKRSET